MNFSTAMHSGTVVFLKNVVPPYLINDAVECSALSAVVCWVSACLRPSGAQTSVATRISAAFVFISLRPKLGDCAPIHLSSSRYRGDRLPGDGCRAALSRRFAAIFRFAALSRCVSSVTTGTEPEVEAHACVRAGMSLEYVCVCVCVRQIRQKH